VDLYGGYATVSDAEAVTLSIAVLGAVLGLINTWRSIDTSRVKLKVVPGHAVLVGSANPAYRFYVSVTNLGAFAVTIEELGFLYKGTDRKGVLVEYLLSDGGALPKRLEPRAGLTAYCERPAPLGTHSVKCAYASRLLKYAPSQAHREPSAG